jgi:hypothetical protein
MKLYQRARIADETKLYSSPKGFNAVISPTSGSVVSMINFAESAVELRPTWFVAVIRMI